MTDQPNTERRLPTADEVRGILKPDPPEQERCPTCGSSNPWFTRCLDADLHDPQGNPIVDGKTYPRWPRGCSDPFHSPQEGDEGEAVRTMYVDPRFEAERAAAKASQEALVKEISRAEQAEAERDQARSSLTTLQERVREAASYLRGYDVGGWDSHMRNDEVADRLTQALEEEGS